MDPRYKWAYNGLIAGTDPVAVEADKTYGLGTSDWSKIKVEHFGWEEELLLG